MDYVFFGPLTWKSLGLQDQKFAQNILFRTGGPKQKNLHATNSFIAFNQVQHPALLKYMENIVTHYKGQGRTEIGPLFLTSSFKTFCNQKGSFDLANLYDLQCHNLTAVEPDYVNPVRPGQNNLLFRGKAFKDVKEWDAVLKRPKGIAIHVYSSATFKNNVSGNALKDVYSYLGPTSCPMSYSYPKEMIGSYMF